MESFSKIVCNVKGDLQIKYKIFSNFTVYILAYVVYY